MHKYRWCSRRHVTSHWLAGAHASLMYVVGWWHVCHSSFIVNCEFMLNKVELLKLLKLIFCALIVISDGKNVFLLQ
jgi:hypothetical protein